MKPSETDSETNDHVETEGDDGDDWDIILEPRGSILSLQLSEVWRSRDLLLLFVRRDIVAFYKQTILGPLWFLIQPILTTLVFVLVFGRIAGLSTDGLPKILFYLCGVTFWNYFSECFNKTATVFRDNAHLFGKVYFPRIISPLSIVISNLVRFAIQFSLFILVALYYYIKGDAKVEPTVVLLPITIATMAMLGLGIGMIFSAMTSKYRDLVYLIQFGVQLLMYATPVIYPISQVPENLKPFLAWNPLAPLFEATRHGFLGEGSFSYFQVLYSVSFSIVLLLLAILIFNRVERTFMDTV